MTTCAMQGDAAARGPYRNIAVTGRCSCRP
jgi:hypothetical protein